MHRPSRRQLTIIGSLTTVLTITATLALVSRSASSDEVDAAAVSASAPVEASPTAEPPVTETPTVETPTATGATVTTTAARRNGPSPSTTAEQRLRSFRLDASTTGPADEVDLGGGTSIFRHHCLNQDCSKLVAAVNDESIWKLWLAHESGDRTYVVDSEVVVEPISKGRILNSGNVYEYLANGDRDCSRQYVALYDQAGSIVRAWTVEGGSITERAPEGLHVMDECRL